MDISIWLNRFGHILHAADDPEEFKTQLMAYSENEDGKYLYECCEENFSEWNQDMWEAKSQLPPDDFQNLKQKGEAYASLQQEAERLQALLRDIIEPTFL